MVILENFIVRQDMTADLKRTEEENLITKIKTQQEIIAKQTIISTIDIDLQLDYIRALYEHYIALKQRLILKEILNQQSILSECGTLPLFENFEKSEPQKAEEKVEEMSELEEIEEEQEDEFEEEIFEKSEDFEDEFEEEENFERLEEEEEEESDDEDELFEEEEDLEDELEEDIEAVETEEKTEDESFISVFPDVEIEMDIQTNSDIDIDAIEFDVEDEEDAENEDDTKNIPITHISTAGQPRYWGDELDFEPISPQPTSIGDKYISNKPSLNEIVSSFKPDESIGMKLQHGSVSDLMKSIDMNLKFLFVKNLFKGNGSVFTEEINKINTIGKLQEAIKYMEEMKNKYNWDDKSEAYSELYKLILRKYAK